MTLFKRIRTILTLDCQEAARLMSDRSERPLALFERIALRGHLAICNGCRRYQRYLRSLRAALGGNERADAGGPDAQEGLSEEARERLKNAIDRG